MEQMQTRTKKIDLNFIGEAWQGCYLELRAPRLSDLINPEKPEVKRTDSSILKEAFVSGQMVNTAGQQVPMEAANIDQFDLDTFKQIAAQYFGVPSPNA